MGQPAQSSASSDQPQPEPPPEVLTAELRRKPLQDPADATTGPNPAGDLTSSEDEQR